MLILAYVFRSRIVSTIIRRLLFTEFSLLALFIFLVYYKFSKLYNFEGVLLYSYRIFMFTLYTTNIFLILACIYLFLYSISTKNNYIKYQIRRSFIFKKSSLIILNGDSNPMFDDERCDIQVVFDENITVYAYDYSETIWMVDDNLYNMIANIPLSTRVYVTYCERTLGYISNEKRSINCIKLSPILSAKPNLVLYTKSNKHTTKLKMKYG